MVNLLNGYDAPEQLIENVGLLELGMFAAPPARAEVERLLGEGAPAEFTHQWESRDGRTFALRCRGVALREGGDQVSGSVWVVEAAGSESPA
jgi:hypothetical protein